MIEHDDVSGDRHDRAHDMLDDDNRQTPFCQVSNQRHRLIDLGVVQSRHHLVKQQEPRLGCERTGHFQPALIYGGQFARRRVFLGGKSDEVDRGPGPGARNLQALVAQKSSGHDVRQHRHLAERPRDLKRARQSMSADFVRPQPDQFAAERGDRAGVGAIITGDQIETRGLAGAVGSDQRDGLAVAHGKAEILDRAQAAEPFAQIADDERLSHRAALLLRAPDRHR